MIFNPETTRVLVYINLIAGFILASGGTLTAGLATFGHGVGQVVAAILAVAGVVQMLASGLLQLGAVRAQTAHMVALATVSGRNLTAAEVNNLKLAA